MKLPLNRIIAAILLTIPFCVLAQQPRTGKEPAWITSKKYDYTLTRLDKEAEDGYVDLVYERQVSLQDQVVYTKKASKIISEAGVQNHSEISVNFDPSYNSLIFHSIRVIRNGESSDRLNISKFRMVNQETELNRFLYNGTVTAILFLEDIRKGDIIEYSYSTTGFNPVFRNKFSNWLDANFRVPVYDLFYKVVVPRGRAIRIKNFNCDIVPVTQALNNSMAYEWRFSNVPALRVEDNLPSWYDPYTYVSVSEYNSWQEVNDWARQLFPFTTTLSPALKKKIAEIKNSGADDRHKTLAALHFVQDEIRYMGIEMGASSHRPNDPNKVFAQRFGDCKDKSYLLCTLLRALDIKADPVLINTGNKKTITGWLPAAGAFDHVTVRVQLDGKDYWFDPTISYQRGPLEEISYPDYQCGLVITDTTTGLTIIPNQEKGLVDIKEEFDITDFSAPARLMVKTIYSGTYADDQRDLFNSSSIFEIQKRFEKYYSDFFEKIKSDSITHTDDDKTGKFVTTEYYTIPDFWESEKGISKGYVSPFVIRGVMTRPVSPGRSMPLRINHPANYREEVLVNLPREWEIKYAKDEISCAAFKLHYEFSYTYKKIRLKCDYQALKDHVSPAESKAFYSRYKQADKDISYELSYNRNISTPVVSYADQSTGIKTIISIVLVLIGIIASVVWRKQRR
jgi:transglutaminase-like putative cysteine protease